MLILTNGQLVSIQNLSPAGNIPSGLEIGISYTSDQTGDGLMFSRIYYINERFTSFTIGSVGSDAYRLSIYKTSFFNSINFY
jgi:hypothetical protein